MLSVIQNLLICLPFLTSHCSYIGILLSLNMVLHKLDKPNVYNNITKKYMFVDKINMYYSDT